MITCSFAKTVHDRLAKSVLGKTFRKDTIDFLIIKISQHRKQVMGNGFFMFSAALKSS